MLVNTKHIYVRVPYTLAYCSMERRITSISSDVVQLLACWLPARDPVILARLEIRLRTRISPSVLAESSPREKKRREEK